MESPRKALRIYLMGTVREFLCTFEITKAAKAQSRASDAVEPHRS